jgi:hypothetical protein
MTSRRALSAFAIAVLIPAVGLACDSEREGSAPEPGTELYAVEPGAIEEVLFSSPDRKMLAFRWTPDTTFQLVFATRGRPDTERCAAGDGFRQWLAAVATIRVGRQLDRPFDPSGGGWADLRLRDTTQIDPIETRLRVPPSGGEPVVIEFGAQQYSVEANAAAVRTITSGCSAFGAARAARPR